jgi:hypothetical protein
MLLPHLYERAYTGAPFVVKGQDKSIGIGTHDIRQYFSVLLPMQFAILERIPFGYLKLFMAQQCHRALKLVYRPLSTL